MAEKVEYHYAVRADLILKTSGLRICYIVILEHTESQDNQTTVTEKDYVSAGKELTGQLEGFYTEAKRGSGGGIMAFNDWHHDVSEIAALRVKPVRVLKALAVDPTFANEHDWDEFE